MKKLWLSAAIAVLFCSQATIAEESAVSEEKLTAYRAAAKAFFEDLKGELQKGIQEGGAVAAIGICNTRAAEIAAQHTEKNGWEVGRTSLKLRSQKNAPDEWETKVLQSFEERKAKGEDPAKIEKAEVVEGKDGVKQIRYMKAIPTAELCVTCHGENIAPEIKAKLQELYPEDKATGFKVGDLRGAFTFTETLKPAK